jgi:uncharacterized protein with von Willebrand factor type A (vWA) domain
MAFSSLRRRNVGNVCLHALEQSRGRQHVLYCPDFLHRLRHQLRSSNDGVALGDIRAYIIAKVSSIATAQPAAGL